MKSTNVSELSRAESLRHELEAFYYMNHSHKLNRELSSEIYEVKERSAFLEERLKVIEEARAKKVQEKQKIAKQDEKLVKLTHLFMDSYILDNN